MSASGAPSWLDMTPDWRVAAFTVGVAFVAAILLGLAPALQIARQRRRSARIRQVMIGAQVAASCVLLIVAGLLVRALDRMTSLDPGFAYQQVIAINPDLAAHGYSPERAGAYLNALRSRLGSLPGVASVSMASTPPLGRKKTVLVLDLDGRRIDVHVNHVDDRFLATLGIPFRRGRPFAAGERGAAMVSESLARALWPNQDPLGRELGGRTVVGIVGSARQTALQDPDAVEAYFPVEAAVLPAMSLLVKVSGRPEDVLRPVASTVQPRAGCLRRRRDAQDRIRAQGGGSRAHGSGVSLLGISALLLACVGVVGLVAFAVATEELTHGAAEAIALTRSRHVGTMTTWNAASSAPVN